MKITKLSVTDILPLTCSRTGTCCHGNLVLINAWELARIAQEKKITPREFLDLYCDFGGIRLRFDGGVDKNGQQACSQYIENFGCSVHPGRPLACRLYPLGRQIQSDEVCYMHQGEEFPCLEGCPEVAQLPTISVGDYLKGQLTDTFEQAQDVYLEMMQNLADIALVLLLDTGLAQSGDKKTLAQWKKMGSERPEILAERIGEEWLEYLMLPDISVDLTDPALFAQEHNELLQLKAQEAFGALQTNEEFHEASVFMMAVVLHFARSLGANPQVLAQHWIDIAKSNGALG